MHCAAHTRISVCICVMFRCGLQQYEEQVGGGLEHTYRRRKMYSCLGGMLILMCAQMFLNATC
jgi:hypothetical protein